MEKSSFFDAVEVNGQYDRVYNANDLTDYLKGLFTSGVLMKQDENLQLVANGDMTVTLKPGIAYIDGKRYSNETDKVFMIADADGTLNRIDRLSVTLDSSGRIIEAVCRQGASSYNPVAPLCRRNADYTDYVIADIYVGAGVISISQADITDQRLNDELCGIVAPFTEVDTTNIYNQFQQTLRDFIANEENIFAGWTADQRQNFESWSTNQKSIFELWKTTEQADFEAWVATLRNILDQTTAGHLQNEIEALTQEVFERYYNSKLDSVTTFNPDGSIHTVNDEAVIDTVFGYDSDGNETAVTTLTPNGAAYYFVQTTTFTETQAITTIERRNI